MGLHISEKVLELAAIEPEELLLELAVYLYDQERMSLGQAKALAQLDRIQFQQALAERNVCIKYDEDDLEQDLKDLAALG
ncbi:MAG: UPF0175 family protein [Bacteroidota bacterium]